MLPRELVTLDKDLLPVRRLKRLGKDQEAIGRLTEHDCDRLFCNCIGVIADLLRESGDIGPDSSLRLLSKPGKQIARIDVLLAEVGPREEFRRLVLVEDKLSTNRECRRDVLAQILDYAHTLERLSIDEVAEHDPDWVEQFGDAIVRSMRAGDYLLIVCGDAIDAALVSLVRSYVDRLDPSKLCDLALVALGIYTDGDTHFFVPTIVGGTERVGRDLTIRVTVHTQDGSPIGVAGVKSEPTPPPADPDGGAVSPEEYMQTWEREFGRNAADAWNAVREALSHAGIESLAFGNYTGGAPFVYLRHTPVGRIDLLRLSDVAPELRDLLHKNAPAFRDPIVAAARDALRARVQASIVGARERGTARRIYFAVTEAAKQKDTLVDAIRTFAAALSA